MEREQATVLFMEECKPSSPSLPHIRRVVDSTKLSDSISQSESLLGSVECLSSALLGGYVQVEPVKVEPVKVEPVKVEPVKVEAVKVEPVIDCTDYTGVEPKLRLNGSDDNEEGTEWKTAYGMTKEEKDRISNKNEEEEVGERQSVKMEKDDGVKYGEGIGREQENVKDEQQRNSVTDQTGQTHRCQRNRGNSEYDQQEGAELSILSTTCLQKQPRVLICRVKSTDISVSVLPPPPHPMASKEDWGVKVPHTQHELSTLKGSCSLRQRGEIVTRKRKMIGQLERPQKQLPASSDNSEPNRHIMLCPVCHKPQDVLTAHLRRVCMKRQTPEAIAAAMKKAKVDTREHLKTGMVWSYGLIRRIMDDADPVSRLVEELQRRHNVVINTPPQLSKANVTGRPSTSTTPQSPETAAPETGESEQSDHASVSSGEMLQCEQENKQTNTTRKLMAEKGLYKKHSLDHPLLKDFGTHLEKDLQKEHYKQEVENVARFLYYMDPQQPSLEFVRDRKKSELFFRELIDAKLSKQTVQNYHKSLKRFLWYHTVNTNLRHEDVTLHGDCKQFIDYIGVQQKCLSKQVSKEITQKRHEMLIEKDPLTPQDCLTVLKAARKDFLGVIGKANEEDSVLEVAECGFVLYYLEAVLILKRLQRPGVVEHMTVKEWDSRVTDKSGHVIVGVKEHKTAAQQVAVFALSQEEELWFEIYYTRVRPQVLKSKSKKRKRDEAEGESEGEAEKEERFFISTTGRPIYNASNDLNRLQAKYKVLPVTSQLARRVFETATKSMSDAEKSLVVDYLTHSTASAEQHHRMKQSDNIVRASQLLAQLAGDTSPDEGSGPTTSGAARNDTQERGSRMELQVAYDKLLETHPVTVDGEVPDKPARRKVSPEHQQSLYNRWLKVQMRLRVQHVLSHFCRRLPKEERVSTWINKQGWRTNIPSAARIVREWKPSGHVDEAMDSKQIRQFTGDQNWKGLLVKTIDGKGKGVVATRRFQAGEVVCDYHGLIVTAQEGKNIQQSTSAEETGYMFFYMNSRHQKMCVDARSPSCECHPGKETFGRLINHSSKNFNLKLRCYTVDIDGQEKDVILFFATKNIDVHEELLFDYD